MPISTFKTFLILSVGFALAPGICLGGEPSAAAITVGFDQSQYQVKPDESFSVRVVIPPLPNGLFSYGVKLIAPTDKASPASSDAIVVPPPLNFNGVAGPGAFMQIQDGTFGVKGTVDFNSINAAFKDTFLATFTLKNKAAIGQTYVLTLDFFRTLGPKETLFVDGAGANLDPLIVFGSTEVMVVPEPPVLTIAGLSTFAVFLLTRRRT